MAHELPAKAGSKPHISTPLWANVHIEDGHHTPGDLHLEYSLQVGISYLQPGLPWQGGPQRRGGASFKVASSTTGRKLGR